MQEERQDEVQEPQVAAEEMDKSKREFVTKLVTAAGAVAVAGLAGSAYAQSSDQDLKLQIVHQKVDKMRNGFRLTFQGGPIGQAMIAAGIAPPDISPVLGKVTIEFTA